MQARRVAVILGFALVGWALCGAVVMIGREITSIDNALIAHAIAAPIIFAVLTWLYFARFAYTTPLLTAAIFTGFVIAMDAVVTALLIERSFEMFSSILGTWLPFTLIFGATYLTGSYVTRGSAPQAI